jgi:hypothetical protein
VGPTISPELAVVGHAESELGISRFCAFPEGAGVISPRGWIGASRGPGRGPLNCGARHAGEKRWQVGPTENRADLSVARRSWGERVFRREAQPGANAALTCCPSSSAHGAGVPAAWAQLTCDEEVVSVKPP